MVTKPLKIVQFGHPALRRVCRSVADVSDRGVRRLVEEMVDLLLAADGLGLSAPQTGRSERLFVMVTNPDRFQAGKEKAKIEVVANPRLLAGSKKKIAGWEGCLSVPGLVGLVERADWVRVEYFDRRGEKVRKKLAGFLARIFQHEYDHLEGKLFLDRVEVLKNSKFNSKPRRVQGKGPKPEPVHVQG